MIRKLVLSSLTLFSIFFGAYAQAVVTACIQGPFGPMDLTLRSESTWTLSESVNYSSMIYITDFYSSATGPLRGVGGGPSIALSQPVGHYLFSTLPPTLFQIGAQSFQYRIDYNPTQVVPNPSNDICSSQGIVSV